MKEIVQKLKKYEIRIRKAINMQMQGDYHSIFKGSGIEFDDVRAYQYGDDVRAIDWNVTAKGHGTFVKTFREEKEQTVFFLLDVSASQEIGNRSQKKIDVSKEICGVLSLSAVKENSEVGVICFSDDKEKYIKPGKGLSHAYELISTIFTLKAKSLQTDLNKAIRYTLNLVKRRSIIILVSDFIDNHYEQALKALAQKHDLVVIHISDSREVNFPKLGIIPLYDKEKGKTIWVNTSSGRFATGLGAQFQENKKQLESLCKKYQANYLFVDTSIDYIPDLIKLFKIRNRGMKRQR
jgi:uncharacterized protein (DUF58 family)